MSPLKLDPSDHVAPIQPIYSDKNRNGVLSLYGLGRWSNLTAKLILKAFSGNNFGFVYAAHTTFDTISQCLYQSKWSSLINMSLITSAYYTEYGTSSYYAVKHVKKQGKTGFIGHEISLSVAINRMIRKKKPINDEFKQFIDANWNLYPKELKPQYYKSKNILLTHLNELKHIGMNKIENNKLLYSHKMQLRYFDEDRNHHLNSRKYYVLIEEALMNYDNKMAMNKYLNYSISIVYWKETPVKKYKNCYVNICKKNTILLKNNINNKNHIGWDFYGVLCVCKCCQRNYDLKEEQNHKHQWIYHTGFVLRVFDRTPSNNINSKL
eukprot:649_1